jgi:hypothetical protein
MSEESSGLEAGSMTHKRSRNLTKAVLAMSALAFAAYSVAAMSSPTSYVNPLHVAYAQDGEQQDQSAIMDKATRMSAAVDATLRYYANATGAQYVETDVRPIAGAENINALDDVTIPSVPVGNTEVNTTGITSMGDYLIATGLIDKSYELFLETAREMRNVTIEDVNEIQTSLLQLHTLIDDRAPYTLAEDVVQNLQGHLQRTVGSTEEFATAGTTTNADTATTTTTDSTTADNATSTTTSTTPSEGTTTADTGMTDDTTTAPSSLMQ